jgi:hypothetical protein
MTSPANDRIIPPKLENALGSLGTTLETELVKYRQLREGGSPDANSTTAEPTFSPNADWPDHEDHLGDASTGWHPSADNSQAEALTLTHVNSAPDLNAAPNHLEAELDAIADDAHFQALTRSLLQPDLNPKDYLESSEALLKNVGAAEQPRPTTVSQGWVIAAGVGLVLSLIGAYLIINPGLWQQFRSQPAAENPSPAAPSPATATLSGPSLDQKEFKDLNIGNLTQVPASPPTNAAPGAVTPSSASPQSTSSPDLSQSVSLPPPQTAAAPASPSPSPTTPQAVPAGSDNFFYVVTEYGGEPAFQKARQALPNAFLVNFQEGTRVQFGAFLDMGSAQTLVRSLKNRGIETTVREPRPQN